MPTDEERREVARRLREMAEERFDFCAHNVALEIGLDDPSDFDDLFDEEHEEAWLRLADLIDPPAAAHECVPGECPLNVRHDNDLIEPSERACYYYDSETNRCGCYDTRLVDRERLLAIATMMAADSVRSVKQGISVSPVYILHAARNIAEACGETFGSIRNRELAKWGTSIVPKETIVDRDALLKLADEMEQAGKEYRYQANENAVYSDLIDDAPEEFVEYARRIREALGEVEK